MKRDIKQGRPRLKDGERKSVIRSVRLKTNEFSLIKRKYGSVQKFFDNCLSALKKKDV